jgi:transcriptional regulator with XRE-family HTH domain
MGQSADLVEALKRELRARKLTYQQVAAALSMAESSVKRMFSSGNLTLDKLETICSWAEIDYASLVRSRTDDLRMLASLTRSQEAQLVGDPKLFLITVCLMNHVSFEQILESYTLEPTDVISAMAALDRIGLIKLLPNNRYKLLLSRTFGWIPGGPIQQYFKANVPGYFNCDFSAPGEMLLFFNVRLSQTHAASFADRIKRMARDLSDQHNEDANLALSDRPSLSVLVAARHWHLEGWELDFMSDLTRRRK